jgi:hypothetical protein
MNVTPDPMEQMPHPTDETLAAFIDDRLDQTARRTVIEHIALCAECRDIVMTGIDFQGSEPDMAPQPVVTPFRFTPHVTFGAAVGLAAAAVVMLVFGPMLMQRKHEREDLDNLVAAANLLSTRHLLPRLSGGFPHRLYKGPIRGEGGKDEAGPLFDMRVDLIEAKPADDRVLAAAQLLDKKYGAAVSTLEQATKAKPRDPDLLNDLSAAYYARGAQKSNASDFAAALDAANRAWALKQTPEIAWNRALALSQQRDPVSQQPDLLAAERAWDDYLEIEQDPDWKAEGTALKATLREPRFD